MTENKLSPLAKVSIFIRRRWPLLAMVLMGAWFSGAFSMCSSTPEAEVHAGYSGPPISDTQKADLQFRTQVSTAQLAVFNSFAAVGLSKPPTVMVGDVACEDWTALVASDGNLSGWIKAGTIQHITIHSAGTETPADAQSVARWHVGGMGWDHEAYNLFALKNGKCQLGLPTGGVGQVPLTQGTMPYGQFGLHNPNDVSIMLEGLVNFTPQQQATARKLVVALSKLYTLQPADIVGHRTWTQVDQKLVAAGRFPAGQTPNDHVDPCASAAPCNFDSTYFGYREAVTSAVTTRPSDQQQTDYPWDGTGTTTFYADDFQGKPMKCGAVYDMDNAHTVAVYLQGGQPVVPCGTWLRVQSVSTGHHIDVKVTDTGNFGPWQSDGILDLSKAAFGRLANLSTGRLVVQAVIAGQDDNQCKYVPESNPFGSVPFAICGAFRDPYFQTGGQSKYGFPSSAVTYDQDGSAKQLFSGGYNFRWTPAEGVRISGPNGDSNPPS